MKLLKKLLPVATIASSIACVAPIMTACGSGVGTSTTEVKDYKTKITPLEEGTTFSSEAEGIKAYFTNEKVKEIIPDDVLTLAATLVNSDEFKSIASYFTSWSIKAGVSISNINSSKGTISGAISLSASVEGKIPASTIEGVPEIEGKASASANFTVTNLSYGGEYYEYTGWTFGLGATKTTLKETSGKIAGNISWSASDVKIGGKAISEIEEAKPYLNCLNHSTGTRTVTYDNYQETWSPTSTTSIELDEKFDLYIIGMMMGECSWTSNYFQNVTINE